MKKVFGIIYDPEFNWIVTKIGRLRLSLNWEWNNWYLGFGFPYGGISIALNLGPFEFALLWLDKDNKNIEDIGDQNE